MMTAAAHEPITATTIVDVLWRHATDHPDRGGFTFLADGEVEAGTCSYAQLAARVQGLGTLLRQLGAQGERALMLYHPGLDLVSTFLACLYANVVAVPLPPPTPAHRHRYLPRLRTVLQDAQARFILSTRDLRDDLAPLLAASPGAAAAEWIATDAIDAGDLAAWRPEGAHPEQVAYLQYTSGSTSAPKGVMITHANVMKACDYNTRLFGWQRDSATVCWMPYFHDYGLVDGIVLPLYNGSHAYLMAPLAFVQRPIRWLRAISKYRATHSSGPNFAYDLCVRKTTARDRAGLDLSSWRSAANAAEPIRIKTVERFIAMYEPHGFSRDRLCPGWGLAEATLVVTARKGPRYYAVNAPALTKDGVVDAEPGERDARTIVGCGLPLAGLHDMRVIIVDPQTMAHAAANRVGEIWVGGGMVAAGYWNKPEATSAIFHAHTTDTGEGPFLRTGDLGYLRDGELVFAGRLKDLIVIEGRNHYPQDVEITAEASHEALRAGCTAAFAIDGETSERVVLVAELSGACEERGLEVDRAAILKAVRRGIVAEHGIRVHDVVLIRPGTLPKTSSGKLQRSTCRDRYLAGELERVDEMKRSSDTVAQAAISA